MTSLINDIDHQVGIIIIVLILTVLYLLNYLSIFSKNEDISTGLKRESKLSNDSKDTNTLDSRILHPAQFKKFEIIQIIQISHNTKLFRFKLPIGKSLGLSIGKHISVCAEIDGQRVIRSYTPTSRPDQEGYFELLIKTYELGKLSPYLHSLKIGSSVDIRGPVGRFQYSCNKFDTMGFIAGGTGITPCLQVIRCILEGPSADIDNTKFVLLYQNRNLEDILLKSDIDTLVLQHPGRLQVKYYLSNPNKSWKVSETNKSGYIPASDVQLFLNKKDVQFVGICGPSGFNDAMKKLLVEEAGHNSENVYIW